jgi:hypothetical protein
MFYATITTGNETTTVGLYARKTGKIYAEIATRYPDAIANADSIHAHKMKAGKVIETVIVK